MRLKVYIAQNVQMSAVNRQPDPGTADLAADPANGRNLLRIAQQGAAMGQLQIGEPLH